MMFLDVVMGPVIGFLALISIGALIALAVVVLLIVTGIMMIVRSVKRKKEKERDETP